MHCEAEFYAQYPHLKPPAYSLPLVCDLCGGDHLNERCMIEVAHPYQPPSPLQEKKVDWEIAIAKLAQLNAVIMEETRANFKNQEAHLQNLEVQIAQSSKQISEIPQETLFSETTPILNESCGAITFMNEGVVE